MNHLPKPDWLTLPETLAHVCRESGAGETETKVAFTRALPDLIEVTRGRKKIFRKLTRGGARVTGRWRKSSNRTGAEPRWNGRTAVFGRGRVRADQPIEYEEVEVGRKHLDRWLASVSAPVKPTVAQSEGKIDDFDLSYWTPLMLLAWVRTRDAQLVNWIAQKERDPGTYWVEIPNGPDHTSEVTAPQADPRH